jgi:hypothetical protein
MEDGSPPRRRRPVASSPQAQRSALRLSGRFRRVAYVLLFSAVLSSALWVWWSAEPLASSPQLQSQLLTSSPATPTAAPLVATTPEHSSVGDSVGPGVAGAEVDSCAASPAWSAFQTSMREYSAVAPPELRPACLRITGWQLVVERLMAHWDVVNILNFGSRDSEEARAVQQLALCAAPLVLNEYNVRPSTNCSGTGWYRCGASLPALRLQLRVWRGAVSLCTPAG